MNLKIVTESTDVSGVVGLGLDLPLGFRVDGRYNFGLTEFFPMYVKIMFLACL